MLADADEQEPRAAGTWGPLHQARRHAQWHLRSSMKYSAEPIIDLETQTPITGFTENCWPGRVRVAQAVGSRAERHRRQVQKGESQLDRRSGFHSAADKNRQAVRQGHGIECTRSFGVPGAQESALTGWYGMFRKWVNYYFVALSKNSITASGVRGLLPSSLG